MTDRKDQPFDVVAKPVHYNSHPSGVEAIEVCRWLDFDLGNVFKYVFRHQDKEPLRSLKSAMWYLDDHITRGKKGYLAPCTHEAMMTMRGKLMEICEHESDELLLNFYSAFDNLLGEWMQNTEQFKIVKKRLQDLIDRQQVLEFQSPWPFPRSP